MDLKLNEMIDISNKCIVNLQAIMHEIKSYSCTIDLSKSLKEKKIKLYFALKPDEFIKLIKRFDLDFCSVADCKLGCKLMVRMNGNIEFFTLLYLDSDPGLGDCLKDKHERELELVEHFLKYGE